MDDPPTTTPRSRPRRSLTKTQLETPAGVELLSLCESITSDGKVTEAEVAELRGWLDRNRDSGLPSEDFLSATVEQILKDGRITPDELQELHKALEAVLPPDLRKEAQEKRRAIAAEERRLAKEQAAVAKEQAAVERERLRPVAVYDFMVAGVMYEGRDEIVGQYMEDDDADTTVYLARDIANPHSDNAVEVRLSDGQCIGYVPERDDMAAEVAAYLDDDHKHFAFVKKILTGGRVPIPVVVAHILRPDAAIEGAVTQDDVPGDPVESAPTQPQPRAAAPFSGAPPSTARGTITRRPPVRARPENAGRSKREGCAIIMLVLLGIGFAIAMVARLLR